jgi:hypothetical protein
MTDRLPPRLRARAADERLQVPAPKCLCSHAKSQHTRGTGQCWLGSCGCASYRKVEPPTYPRPGFGITLREFLQSKGEM